MKVELNDTTLQTIRDRIKLLDSEAALLRSGLRELEQARSAAMVREGVSATMRQIPINDHGVKVHWTQRPENKAKLLAMSKRSARTRRQQNRASK